MKPSPRAGKEQDEEQDSNKPQLKSTEATQGTTPTKNIEAKKRTTPKKHEADEEVPETNAREKV